MIEESIAILEDMDTVGFHERLANGNEGGKLLAKMIDWIYDLERMGGGWYREDDIDVISEIIAESIADMLDCTIDIFTGDDEALNRELGLPPGDDVSKS